MGVRYILDGFILWYKLEGVKRWLYWFIVDSFQDDASFGLWSSTQREAIPDNSSASPEAKVFESGRRF